jgi:nucleoid DNA-binding protein
MTGITEINKLISKEVKVSEDEVKKITMAFLEVTKQSLADGEDVSFKGYFSLTRSKKVPREISKFCDRHSKSVNEYKRTNKGKGINSFSKSPT